MRPRPKFLQKLEQSVFSQVGWRRPRGGRRADAKAGIKAKREGNQNENRIMSTHEVHVKFAGKIVFVGFGSIGQGVLPLILRHIGTSSDRITIVTAENSGRTEADQFGVKFVKTALTRENYRQVLEPLLGAGDFLLNLSVDVSSVALVQLARERGALYLDTCTEPWAGGYTDPSVPVEARSNYAMRLNALKLRNGHEKSPTAV